MPATKEKARERYHSDPEYRARKLASSAKSRKRPEYRERRNAEERQRAKDDPEYAEARRAYQREWQKEKHATDPDYRARAKERKARYRASKKGRETEQAYEKKYRAEHPEVYRDSNFKKHHGITRAEADRMIEAQNGLCAICGNPPSGTKAPIHRLHVDHDKETGQVREMLCHLCNTALGQAGHSPQRLRDMADYLEKHQK